MKNYTIHTTKSAGHKLGRIAAMLIILLFVMLQGYTVKAQSTNIVFSGSSGGASVIQLNCNGSNQTFVDNGWIRWDGLHSSSNDNYYTGYMGAGVYYRSYFAFTNTAGTITSASITMNTYSVSGTGFTVNYYAMPDYSVAQLDADRSASDATGIAIFNAMGTGTFLGSSISGFSSNQNITTSLNVDALNALGSSIRIVAKVDDFTGGYTAPVIATNAATSITTTSAQLNGTLTANSNTGTVHFDYGTSPGSYTISTSDQSYSASPSASVSLSSGITYYYRAHATVNSHSDIYGSEVSFSTPPANPTGITGTTTICNGTGTTLTATGIDGTVYWYSGSCGGTFVNTGNSIIVYPTTTTTYYAKNYKNALSSAGCASAQVTVNDPATMPASAVINSVTESTASISWGASSGTATITHYWLVGTSNTVVYGTVGVAGVVAQGTTNVSTTTATATGLSPSTNYYLRVFANSDASPCGASAYRTSVMFTTVPAAPVAGAASDIRANSFTANWAASTGATKYYLDVATNAAFTGYYVSGFQNKDVGTAITYPITGLSNTTTYYYRVRAYNAGGSSVSSGMITLETLPVNNFLVEAVGGGTIPTQTAGVPFSVKITARDAENTTVTDYTGTTTITSNSTLTAGGTTANFVAGVLSSHSVTLTQAGISNKHLTASIVSPSVTSNSTDFTVDPAAINHWTLAVDGTVTAGTPFTVTATVYDQFGNLKTNYTGANSVNWTTTATSSPNGTARIIPANGNQTFVNGVAAGITGFTFFNSDQSQLAPNIKPTITITDGSTAVAGTTAAITVLNAPLNNFKVEAGTTQSAGVAFSTTVTARDIYLNTCVDYAGNIRFKSSNDALVSFPAGLQSYAPASTYHGVRTFTNEILINTIGAYWLRVADAAYAYKSGEQQNIVVGPGAFSADVTKSTLTIAPSENHSAIADPLSRVAGEYVYVTLVPKDAQGNLLYECRDISVLLRGSTSDLSGPIIVNNVGNGSYTALVRVTVTGDNVISARYNSTATLWDQTRTVTVSPAPVNLDHTLITAIPSTMTTDEFSNITVQLKDEFNNNRTTSDGTVTLATTKGVLTGGVTDNNNGTYSAVLYGNYGAVGIANITGSLAGAISGPITDTENVTINEGLPALSTIDISLTPSEITTNQNSLVSVQLKDQFGNLVTTDAGTVALTTDKGVLSSVTYISAGVYQATLSGNMPGSGLTTVTGTYNSGAIADYATLTFNEGLPNLAHIEITALPTTMTSDGSSVITVQLKDIYGNNITTSRGTVTLFRDKGALTSVTDHGDGTYSATLTGDNRGFGDATITGHLVDATDAINGDITDNAVVNITEGKPDLTDITITPASGTMTTDETRLITVRLKDQFGNNLSTSRGTVTLATSLTGTALTAVTPVGDGTYTATLSTTVTGTATITGHLDDGPDVIDGDITHSGQVIIGEGKPALAQIQITVSDDDITTDETSTITVQLRDQWGNNLTGERGTVTLASSAHGSIGTVTYAGSGTYTATLSGDNRGVGSTLITGVLNDVDDGITDGIITDNASVTFTEGLPSLAVSDISVDNAIITTDGTSTITVQLKDALGNLIVNPRGTVSLTSDLGLVSAVSYTSLGRYTATLTGDNGGTHGTGTATISGSFAGTGTASGVIGSFTDHESVTINEGSPSLTISDISIDNATITTDGTSTITVQLKDALGNLIVNNRGTVSLTSTIGLVSAVTYAGTGIYTATLTGDTRGTNGTGSAAISGSFTGTGTALGVIGSFSDGASVTIEEGLPALSTTDISASPTTMTTDQTSLVTVQLKDQFGNLIVNDRSTVALSTTRGVLTENGTYLSAGRYTATLHGNSSGVGTASITGTLAGDVIGSIADVATTVEITEGLPSLTTTTFTPSAASITTDETSVITIQLKDQFGNLITNERGTVVLSATIGSLGAVSYTTLGRYTATLSGDTRGLNGTGSSVITGTLDGNALSQSTGVTITEGLPRLNKIQITASPTSIIADVSSTITVQLQDQFGNNITHSRGGMSLSSAGLTGTSISSVTNNNNGTYTASFSMIASGTGTATISGNFTGTGDAVTIFGSVSDGATIDVTHGVATKLAMKTQPSTTATAGVAFAQQPELYIQDQFGNTVLTDNSTVVTAARASGSATLLPSGGLTATATAGVVTFSGLKYNKAETITLGFTSSPNLTPATSGSIVVAHADPAYLAITGASMQVAGASQTIIIRAYDAFDNPATAYTGTKTLVFTGANPSSAAAAGNNMPTPTTPATNPTAGGTAFNSDKPLDFTSGVASISMNLYKTETALVSVSDGAISSFASASLDHRLSVLVTPALLFGFLVSDVPDPHDLGTRQPVTVEAIDTYNNRKTNYVGSITFSNTDIGATNPVDYHFTIGAGADNGIHTFSNVSGSGTNQGVKFSQTGLDWWLTAVDLAEPVKYGAQSGITVQRAVTIASTDQSKTYGDTHDMGTTGFTITAIHAPYGEVVGEITGVTLTSAGSGATATVAGSPYDIVPSAVTSGSYDPALYRIEYASTGKLTVNRRNLTLTNFLANNKIYDGTTDVTGPSGSRFSDNRVNSDVLTFSYTAAFADRNWGTGKTVNYTGITISGAGAGNYTLLTTSGSITADIAKRPIDVTAVTDTKTYDGSISSDETPTVPALQTGDILTFAGIQTYDTESFGTGKTLTPSGTVITDGNSSANYAITNVTNSTGIISQRPITITVTAGQTKVYGVANPTSYTYSITSGNLATDDEFSGALSRATGENVNTYAIGKNTLTIVEGLTNKESNYVVTFEADNYTITRLPIAINVNTAQTKVYGDLDPTFTFTTNPTLADLPFPTKTWTGALERVNTSENVASNYAITKGTLELSDANSSTSLATNYNVSFTGADFAITPKAIAVTPVAGQNKTYGNLDPVSYTYTTNPAIGSDLTNGIHVALSGALTRDAGEDVGTYAITQGNVTSANNTNYTVSFTSNVLFTINRRAILVTATAGQHKTYGDVNPTYTFTTTGDAYGSTLSNGHTVALNGALTRVAGENVGAWAITQGTILNSNNGNYEVSFATADFTINRLPITVTANTGQTKVYGNADPVFTFTTSPSEGSSLANGIVVGLSGVLTRDAGSNVGLYAIRQGTITNATNGNYDIPAEAFTTNNFSITERPITITANARSKTYGNAITLGTSQFGITGYGMAYSESITSVTLASLGTPVDAHFGTYPITTASAAGSGGYLVSNYNITYSDAGVLTVNKRTLTLSNFAADSKMYDGNQTATGIGFTDDRFAGDNLSFQRTAEFATKDVANGIAVNYTGIAITGGSDMLNYQLTSTTGTALANISAKPLTITANSFTKTQGTTYTFLGTEFTTSGLITGESVASATLTSDGATSGAISGPFDIVPSLAIAGGSTLLTNYAITYTKGVLTVGPAENVDLTGSVVYTDHTNTNLPMEGLTVTIRDGSGAILYSATTNSSGGYQFMNVPAAIARLGVSTSRTWNGVNATDALAIQLRTVGTPPSYWTPTAFMDYVGNVSSKTDPSLDAQDVLWVKGRVLHPTNPAYYFPAGDWAFYANSAPLTQIDFQSAYLASPVASSGVLPTIYVRPFGDIYGDYAALTLRSGIIIQTSDVVYVPAGKPFELPVQVMNDVDFSALTLILTFNSDKLKVDGLTSDIPGLEYVVEGNIIRAVWTRIEPVHYNSGQSLVKLQMRTIGEVNQNDKVVSMDSKTEFADSRANVIPNIKLAVASISTSITGFSEFCQNQFKLQVYPNPFTERFNLKYTLSERADVLITLLDNNGRLVSVLDKNNYPEGVQTFEYLANWLASGTYYVNVSVNGRTSSFNSIQKLIHRN